ncbi:transcriptional adapter 1-like isoform X2 [Convolutriloba macropyga]|uniref:transcriptional adapter 1-like isoform X2 n=1 Tax=Convolutriloba macropyga TaxID=536237 RepID=UPI003F526581
MVEAGGLSVLTDELNQLRKELSNCLGEYESEYQSLMREWFGGRLSKVQLDENIRAILSPHNVCKHNFFLIKLFSFCRQMSISAIERLNGDGLPEANAFDESDSNSPQSKKLKVDLLKAAAESNRAKLLESTAPIEGRTSWKQNTINRILPIAEKSDIKGANRSENEAQAMKQTEGIVGRLYISLWEHGLHTVTHECVLVILKAAIDLIRRIVRQLVGINFSRKIENPSNNRPN